MKKQKIAVDILEFFKTCAFGGLIIGQKDKSVRKNFGKPCHTWYDEQSKTEIWTYGKLELFFYKNKLAMIFSDHFHDDSKKGLYGNKHVYIKPWILGKPKKLTLCKVLAQLNKQGIDYQKVTKSLHVIVTLPNGVELTFENPKGKTDKRNCNQFILSAFSLTDDVSPFSGNSQSC